MNTSNNNYIVYTNGTMKSYVDAVNLAINTSNNNYIVYTNETMKAYVDYVNSTNGVGAGSYNDTWINQTIYNKTQVNDINTSMKNYVDTQNTSQTNYINTQNASQTNWVTSTFVSIASIVNLVGNWSADKVNVAFTNTHETFAENVTFVKNISVGGSINLTTNNQKMYYGGGEGQQYYNGTCMIIKGPTSTLEIC
jgi:hypothetical protein